MAYFVQHTILDKMYTLFFRYIILLNVFTLTYNILNIYFNRWVRNFILSSRIIDDKFIIYNIGGKY